MGNLSKAILLAAASLGGASAIRAQPATGAENPVTAYPAGYFARVQPYSALDMIALLPGFKLDGGDADVRGYAGASGNVLIDGERPASKQESIEQLLQRIPASSVERIELIRPGAPGVDMQGRSILANIVRRKETSLKARIEAGSAFYTRGPIAPRLAGELSRRSGESLIEVSAAAYREVDDEHGFGSRDRTTPSGAPVRIVDYEQPEWNKVIEGTAAYERPLAGGKLRLNGLLRQTRKFANIANHVSFPAPLEDFVHERRRTIASELGMHFNRPLGSGLEMETLAIRRTDNEKSADSEWGDAEDAITRQDDRSSETIVRALLRRSGDRLTLEGGGEGALNILDSKRNLTEDGFDVPLPQANVRVEERRAEGFFTATWRMAPQWSLEAGSRFEASRLSQSGDSHLSKTFFYPKPRALLSWAPDPRDQVRLLVEREVGQLTFSDFVGEASLSTGVITAGNPHLEPDKTWRYEAVFERHFGANGSIVLTARHEEISDVVDRIPVMAADGEIFGAVGNIGKGRRDSLSVDLILPLDALVAKGLLFKANLVAQRSRVEDPATGEKRRISEDKPIEGEMHLTYEAPALHSRFGVDVALPSEERSFKFDEIETDRIGLRVGIFAEYKPTPAWNIRLYAKNLTDSPAQRQRLMWGAIRSRNPVDVIELRRLKRGPYAGFTIQRTFG
jgi:outer membrane receptor protein involved in Fe transport